MQRIRDLSSQIRKIGFQCRECGICCRGDEATSRVIVSPPEIDQMLSATKRTRDEIVIPYPEFIEAENGATFTFEWCLKNGNGNCIFQEEGGRCAIYSSRPWICRTYPFALDGDTLTVSECPGTGEAMTPEEADEIASDLLKRQKAEEEEESAVGRIFSSHTIPEGAKVVFDSRGMWSIHG
ncbi:YkgJ family cysteine cluster protein [Methanocalculus taiwanensis]|nr:YkgJ family cysteine cluster protein [Methanocalculus taiwanensis]